MSLEAEATPDRLLGGRLLLRQPARGHRAGTDAVLLAAGAPEAFSGFALDLGAGVGTVGLALALRAPDARVRLVEADLGLAALSEGNAALNGVAGRVGTVVADVLASRPARRAAGIAGADADLVLTNPPFLSPGQGRASPEALRARAHVIGAGGLDLWIAAAADALRPGGAILVIHRADALAALLAALSGGFGGITVMPIHPRAGSPATRVLARAIRRARAPLALAPGLVLHGPDGRFTPEAEAIHRGERLIDW